MKRKVSKVVSVILTVMLLFSVSVTPVAAGQENGRERRNVPTQEIQHLDAEVLVVAGQPVLMMEVPKRFGHVGEYLSTPLLLPETLLVVVDGEMTVLEVKNNSVLLPTKEGTVAVPIEDFCVVMIDGEIVLTAEEEGMVLQMPAIAGNPIPAIIILIAKVTGANALVLYARWSAGICLAPGCFAPTPGGAFGDRFCGHRWCTATLTSLLNWLGP